ncbi:MAG: MinD/ParA family protein [Lachnospiraceae bacterium]|nr:MinD/ParA family protein [Lachnospiraceae bacterium]
MDQAEKLRKLVRQQERRQQYARVITVTSGKGGVGKSSVAVNLAIQMQRLGKRVIVFDADFGLANVEVMLGIRPQFNLADLMFRGKTLAEIITKGPEDIGFISGGSGIQELARLTREQIIYLSQKLAELDSMADIIIVDTGAGIADAVLEFVAASSEVILVATPEPTSITDAYALLKTLNRRAGFSKEHTSIKMISNRVENEAEGRNLYEKMSLVVNKFLNIQPEFIGNIPQDDMVSKAVMLQKPVTLAYPNTPAAKAMQAIAVKLCDGPELEKKKGITGLFSDLIRTMIKKARGRKEEINE